jgi:elongation factor 2
MPGSPLDDTSKPYTICQDIKKRKGLKASIPSLDNYLDKM